MRRALIVLASALVLVFGTALLVEAATSRNAVSCTPGSTTYNADGSGTCSVDVTIPGVKTTETVTATVTATETATVTATPTPTPTPAPTPTPTPTPTATSTPQPGGFPGPSNTGVPAGTNLTTYTGSCNITTAGTTLTAKTINCPDGLLIRAANVSIAKSKITGTVLIDTDVNQTWGLTLTDSDVTGTDGTLPAIFNGNATLLRDNIHGGHNGLECQEHSHWCSIKDSFIHDQYDPKDDTAHLGGMLVLGNAVPCDSASHLCAEVVHNTITCDSTTGCTGDLNLLPHYGPLSGALVQGNYFGANTNASFCTYGGSGMEHPADHIVYRDNVFARGTNNICAAYGPVTNFNSAAAGNVWANNTYTDGTVVAPAN